MRPVRLLLVLLSATSALAADRSLLVSAIFADSSIVGPAVRYSSGDEETTEYWVALLGYTLEGEWVKHRSPRQAFTLAADITPLNSHMSNRIYVDGERAEDLEYEAATYRLRAGLRLTPTARSTTDIRIAALKEQVDENPDPAITEFWDEPFAGLDVTHTWKLTRSERPLVSAFDGFSISARAEVYGGNETWSRLSLSQRAGHTAGKIHLRESVQVMTGKSLNVVSRFLVGGSWDVLAESALYGSRYGEYRIARGVIVNGGADYLLPRQWTAGVRGSYMRSDVTRTHGFALNATKTWRTFGFNMGVGFPKERGGDSDPVLYFGVIAPLYAKGYN